MGRVNRFKNTNCQPDKFCGLIVSNSGLPVGIGATEGFNQWLNYSQTVEDFNSGKIVYQGSMKQLDEEEIAAYNAPFPDETYKAGARAFPLLVPITDAPVSYTHLTLPTKA